MDFRDITLGELAEKLLVTGGNITYVMDRLEEKYPGHPRLFRNVATVITREGLDELVELGWVGLPVPESAGGGTRGGDAM